MSASNSLNKFTEVKSIQGFSSRDDVNGPEFYFEFLTPEGIEINLKLSLATAQSLAFELSGISSIGDAKQEKREPFGFMTAHTAMALMSGGGTDGCVKAHFFTPLGHELETIWGPNLVETIHQQLGDALAGMARKPSAKNHLNDSFGASLPGNGETTGVEYFGQMYNQEILKALGVFLVRANLVEQNLINLLSIIAGIPARSARALFFSTANMKARMDMIAALASESDFDDGRKQKIYAALDKVNRAASRRNKLIHGSWAFQGGNFGLRSFQPNNKHKEHSETVTEKSVLLLASDYRTAGLLIEDEALKLQALYMARNTSATASSGSPEES